MFDIYVIRNHVNEKKYVGYTSKGYENRFRKHLIESENGSSRYLCKAIRKHGPEQFSVELLDSANTHDEAKEKEVYYIQLLKTFAHDKEHHGYNATLGGDGMNGYSVPKSIRVKMSELKRKQLAWVGERNPKYKKGYLIRGEKHPMYGRQHTDEAKEKNKLAHIGKNAGINNPAAKLLECFSLECKTGKISKFESFFEMQKDFKKKGMNFNRSSVLGVMRMDFGCKSYLGHIFFREDVTPEEVYQDVKNKYQLGISEPIELKDHRQGKTHPNAKNVVCYAKDICTGKISKFHSWYDLKKGLEATTKKKLTYSNMFKCLIGKYKHISHHKLYRADMTERSIFDAIINEFKKQTEPSATSRKA